MDEAYSRAEIDSERSTCTVRFSAIEELVEASLTIIEKLVELSRSVIFNISSMYDFPTLSFTLNLSQLWPAWHENFLLGFQTICFGSACLTLIQDSSEEEKTAVEQVNVP